MRYPVVNLGQTWWENISKGRWPWYKEEETEEVQIIVPPRPPAPPPPTPPLSFMMPLRQGPDAPEPPPRPPMPPPPPGKPVATPGNIYQEFASCRSCPDGSYRIMNTLDAAAAGCKAVQKEFCDPYPEDPGEPTVTPIIEDRPMVPSFDRFMPPSRLRTQPPAPVATPATTSQPPAYPDVATEGAGFPTSTGFAPPPPSLPRYTDVATPSTPQYGTDLQRQIDSYSEKLREFSSRPPTPSQSDQYNLTPESMRPGAGPCPPGQFLIDPMHPEKGCRGGVATGGLPGLPGLTSGGATIAPSEFAMPSMPATSFMGRLRFPVVNL